MSENEKRNRHNHPFSTRWMEWCIEQIKAEKSVNSFEEFVVTLPDDVIKSASAEIDSLDLKQWDFASWEPVPDFLILSDIKALAFGFAKNAANDDTKDLEIKAKNIFVVKHMTMKIFQDIIKFIQKELVKRNLTTQESFKIYPKFQQFILKNAQIDEDSYNTYQFFKELSDEELFSLAQAVLEFNPENDKTRNILKMPSATIEVLIKIANNAPYPCAKEEERKHIFTWLFQKLCTQILAEYIQRKDKQWNNK